MQDGSLQKEVATEKFKPRKSGMSNASVNRILAVLRRMLSIALEDSSLSHVPHFPHLSEAGNERTGFVDQATFMKVLAAIKPHLRPLLIFLYQTGCRVGAATKITWEMVSADCETITMPANIIKNREPLTLPVPEALVPILKHAFKVVGMSVFSAKNLRKEGKKAVKAAGVPNLIVHDMRRSAVTNLTAAGVDRKTAMSISGHKSESVFRRYQIVNPEDKKQALRKVDGSLIGMSNLLAAKASK